MKYTIRWCAVVWVAISFAACTMKPKDQIRMYLDLAPTKHKAAKVLPTIDKLDQVQAGILWFPNPTPSPAAPAAATDLSNFDCFAINVMGPGIPSQEVPAAGDPPASVTFAQALSGVPVAYQGIVSSRILYQAGQQTVEMSVPAGSSRLVQLIGMKSAAAGDPISQFCGGATGFVPDGEGFFEVGRSVIPSAYSDVAVTMNEDYVGKPPWYQEYKRISKVNNCKPFGTKYGVGNTTSAAGDAFYFTVDPSPLSIPMDSVTVEVTGAAANTLAARIYTEVNAAPVSMFPAAATYVNMVDSTNTVSFPAGFSQQLVTFNFPKTTIPSSASPTYIIIYTTAANTFSLVGEAGGGMNTPITGDGKYSGTWGTVSPTAPHVMIGSCF